jgi:hypothetical protein
VTIEPEDPGFSQVVAGRVTNRGKKVAKVADASVALYDGAGRLVYVTQQGILNPWPATLSTESTGFSPDTRVSFR